MPLVSVFTHEFYLLGGAVLMRFPLVLFELVGVPCAAAVTIIWIRRGLHWGSLCSCCDYIGQTRSTLGFLVQLLFSRGPLVELLISSNIARYAEFRCVTRVLTWLNDKLMPVPCSRADVFATEAVSIVEKRMLMKMLTSIVGYSDEEMDNEFKGMRMTL